MPFTKSQSSDSSEIRDLAYGWGKIVSRRGVRPKLSSSKSGVLL